MTPRRIPLAALAVASLAAFLATCAGAATATPAACHAESGAMAATVIELYTSEGCDSCPPADRWLGALASRADVVALGFHVDYWDGPGWKDRFDSPAWSKRQSAALHDNGAQFAYTPQVVLDGRDGPDWHRSASPPAPARRAPVRVALSREGDALQLQVTPVPGTPAAELPARLVAELAVVDDGLQSRVAGGENRGATLHHDAVVRSLVALPSWPGTQAHVERATLSAPTAEPGSHRHWAAVVRDPATGRPVQAVALRCE